MKAFHNDEKIKEIYLTRVMARRAADEIIQGIYWGSGKGCGVGCTIHSSKHKRFEAELGIPMPLARLGYSIFEVLSEAKDFPAQFFYATPVGADLSGVADKFLFWLLGGDQDGEFIFTNKLAHAAVIKVRNLLARKIAGDIPTVSEWWEARAAAADAAAADDAYAAYAYADATRTSRHDAYSKMKTKLLQLLGEAVKCAHD